MTLGEKKLSPRVEFIEGRQASLRLLARHTAARFGFLAAVGPLGAALLNGGTSALILGAALQSLFAAAEFGVGHATGTPVFAAGELAEQQSSGFSSAVNAPVNSSPKTRNELANTLVNLESSPVNIV